ncbi:hypothetical protein GT028_10635 [Streptomyces sp. SID2999]|uniref:hypothetical protein n=1 Tax=Streptomyces sp. SID2999 TaxID=2690258 RepID=UPI0014012AD8|nr:hypothetical protein [Streptomyces sp. SID2999]MYZ07826.1 hypothetical protein [Streptomyces sp. SID2999]
MVPALDEAGQRSGAFASEDWADPEAFYTALERVGTPVRLPVLPARQESGPLITVRRSATSSLVEQCSTS